MIDKAIIPPTTSQASSEWFSPRAGGLSIKACLLETNEFVTLEIYNPDTGLPTPAPGIPSLSSQLSFVDIYKSWIQYRVTKTVTTKPIGVYQSDSTKEGL